MKLDTKKSSLIWLVTLTNDNMTCIAPVFAEKRNFYNDFAKVPSAVIYMDIFQCQTGPICIIFYSETIIFH